MNEARAATLAQLQGLLEAFALVNTRTNEEFTFTLDRLPAGPDIESRLRAHIRRGVRALSPVEDWRVTLRATLLKWLFNYVTAVQRRLVNAGGKYDLIYPGEEFIFSDEVYRVEMVNDLLARLDAALQPTRALEVRVDESGGFYACMSDDIVIESPEGAFLMHFDLSD
jgi:hypothetical protein